MQFYKCHSIVLTIYTCETVYERGRGIDWDTYTYIRAYMSEYRLLNDEIQLSREYRVITVGDVNMDKV